ncbi:MAG: PilC/PilY family type IV pilus protein [Polyangiaceae bacterium]
MRSVRLSRRLLLTALTSCAAISYAGSASAQADITPPLPNVLLLVDTSGSMEYMADGTLPQLDGLNRCKPPSVPGESNENRWATLVSVLTGTYQNFSCYAQPRDGGSPFETEYTVSGQKPYDLDYHLPFHRILSNDCTPGPGTLGATWAGWPASAIDFHEWNNAGNACSGAGFQQSADGLLDTFGDRARFGLMTFDPLTNDGTGAAGTSYDLNSGVKGTWSYFLGWETGGIPASGNPPNCAESNYEVGARNAAAPPWEGRLMPFGDPDATAATQLANNEHVQLALLAMRPYGATPLAGMLQDARDFIYNDTSIDPSTTKAMGPSGDDYFKGGCRKTFIIVMSDGEPNLDLRKEGCATGNGKCPYDEPHVIAADMATGGDPDTRVLTFAIGFGLSQAAGIDCNTLTDSDFLSGGQCEAPSGALAACCNLARIAIEGGTKKAYFASDKGSLKSALSEVLGAITSGSKTRTIPTFSSATASAGAQGNAQAVGYRFGAQFDTPISSPLWIGRLVRERYKCVAQGGGAPNKSEPQAVDASKGDDFARNVSSNDSANPRKFMTVIGSTDGGQIHSDRSIRPKLALLGTDDGLGLYTGAATNSGVPQEGAQFASGAATAPEAFGIDAATPPNQCTSQLGTASATACANLLLRWEVGEVDAGLPTRDVTGCQVLDPLSGQPVGCELGSIYHSTPVVVSPPNEFLRDESYDQFALAQTGRPTMLYVATTDGQLHGFKVAANNPNDTLKVDSLANNELWSFLPPAVLPRLLTTYNQQSVLLDGQVVTRDIVLERTTAQAIAGGGAGGAAWRTILLAGGGGGGGYYFALDVTDPTQPEFLWQISQDSNGAPMFGATVPTPAIATISVAENGNPAKDIAVAILPGGADALQAGTCGRVDTGPYPKIDNASPRTSTRCWAATAGRSLTIVRLDNGQVIRSFVSPKATIAPTLSPSRITSAPFDSPLTGVPVPYPSRAGQVSTRVYIGDADGTLWRVDLTKSNPDDWKVEMRWDGYESEGADEGEPIQTPPIVSIDNLGQPVLLFSTGDQELITTTTPKTHLWSLTEVVNGTTFKVKPNFHIDMIKGERVTGPISLFDSTAYFASFQPEDVAASGDACTYGEGKLWGIDYLTGAGRLDPNDASVKSQSQGKNSIVFGVAVTQTPSCYDTTTFDSAYFGGYVGITGGSPGEFQLVYQVSGQPSGGGSGANAVFKTQQLPAPRVTTRIDSWAAVVE